MMPPLPGKTPPFFCQQVTLCSACIFCTVRNPFQEVREPVRAPAGFAFQPRACAKRTRRMLRRRGRLTFQPAGKRHGTSGRPPPPFPLHPTGRSRLLAAPGLLLQRLPAPPGALAHVRQALRKSARGASRGEAPFTL